MFNLLKIFLCNIGVMEHNDCFHIQFTSESRIHIIRDRGNSRRVCFRLPIFHPNIKKCASALCNLLIIKFHNFTTFDANYTIKNKPCPLNFALECIYKAFPFISSSRGM